MSNSVRLPFRYQYLDNWRFVSVVLVVLNHVVNQRNPDATSSTIPAHIGVFIFFFISGFVVSKASLSELASSGRFSIGAFYVRRAFRIVPPLLFYVLVCMVLGKFGLIPFNAVQATLALAYLCNIDMVICEWHVGHTWSLAFEEQFYLLFPLAFLWFETNRRPKVILMALALIAISLPFAFSIGWIGKTGFVVIHALFVMGYLSAKYEQPGMLRPITASLVFLVGLALTFFPVGLFDSTLAAKYYKFVYILSVPMMVLASGSPLFPLRAAYEASATAYIGRISYSIYLWQQLFSGPLFNTLPLPVHLLFLSLMVAACVVLFEYAEKPITRLGRRLSESVRLRSADRRALRPA